MSSDQKKNPVFDFFIISDNNRIFLQRFLSDNRPSLKVGDCVAYMIQNEFTPSKSSGYFKVIQVGKTQYLTEKYDRLNNLLDSENVELIDSINRNSKKYKLTPCQEIQTQHENQ